MMAGAGGAMRATGCARQPSGFNNSVRGPTQCRALSPDFPAGAGGLCRIRPALGMAPALMVCWIEGGAGFFLFSVLPGGAVELPGRSRPAPGGVDLRWGGCGVLSLSDISGWRDGVLYPWRVVAEESGAAHLAFGAARPARADGEAAGGAVDFHFSDIPVRGDAGARAIGANDDEAAAAAAVELPGRRRRHP